MKNLLTVFSPRLTRRITLWIFASILGIEAVILLPSIARRRSELLDDVSMTSMGIATTLRHSVGVSNKTEESILQVLAGLQQTGQIEGAALYRFDQSQPVGTVGEAPEMRTADLSPATPQRKVEFGPRFEVSHVLFMGEGRCLLVLRYNTAGITQEIYWFIVRIGGLVLLISMVVSVTTILVLQRQIISPIVLLRWDLLQAGKIVSCDQCQPEFASSQYRYRDEFGDVVHAFQEMYGQITAEIAARKQSEQDLRTSADTLQQTLKELQSTQAKLVQSEKMSSLGQLVAGVAHEVNNPMNFIHGNLNYVGQVTQDLLGIINQYQADYPKLTAQLAAQIEDVDLEFVRQDLPNLITSMQDGAKRIQDLVLSFRNFSRLDEAERKPADLNQGLDSTLMLLQHRLRATEGRREIAVIKQYQALPLVECYPAQINQVFLSLLNNAVDAIERRSPQADDAQPQIELITRVVDHHLEVEIGDNGIGMTEEIRRHAFDPFFTTKDVGEGQGLGLAISYQTIVDGHQGELICQSMCQRGTTFTIRLPIDSSV
ncbi:HAMP domain-containing histidine kinase [filamentous cyanobacterium LEGE 11480]|uniref:histidine kinase n=1 Tax=Romeriopsis navalis LEGE 11480 TaxID=2777977 RepID=A0A928VPK7_9CYAN|nr:HAMP domain-containing histidine kinase [Romeriopsis navalis]MBE9032346.1 HAMP domain-containing histidine kinase [Romeriopsis navalis LEGE 11480]